MQPSTAINLNINLIKFPQQFQLPSSQTHHNKTINNNYTNSNNCSSNNNNKNKNLSNSNVFTGSNNSITITHNKPNCPPQPYIQNIEDSFMSSSSVMSSFEQFHPTMSTQSLSKAKRIYQKSIKTNNYHHHFSNQGILVNNSRQFYDIKTEESQFRRQNKQLATQIDQPTRQANYKKSTIIGQSINIEQSHHSQSIKSERNTKQTINRNQNKLQDQHKNKNKNENDNSKSTSSINSYNSSKKRLLPVKQPLNLLNIECQDTFEQHESNQFVDIGLFSQHFKKATSSSNMNDKFKKKKNAVKNLQENEQQENNKLRVNIGEQRWMNDGNAKTMKLSSINKNNKLKNKKLSSQSNIDNNDNFNLNLHINQSLKQHQNTPKSKSKSKSKSRSKSKHQNNKKLTTSTSALKKLNFQKQEIKQQQLQIKNKPKNKNKSLHQKSYHVQMHSKEPHIKNNLNKISKSKSKSESKSKSHSKSHKQFIRSKDQIKTNQNLSPSPTSRKTKQNKSKSKSSIEKSKSRSRSNSKIKTFSNSNSKNKLSNQKSINRIKHSHQKQKSYSPSLKYQQTNPKKKYTVKQFNDRSGEEIKQRIFSNSKQKKRSLSKGKSKKSSQNLKSKKSINTNAKQSLTVSKQIILTNEQQPRKLNNANKFSKNKSTKVAYAKTNNKSSPQHSKSTNFYHPELIMREKKQQNRKVLGDQNQSVTQQIKKNHQELKYNMSIQQQRRGKVSSQKKKKKLSLKQHNQSSEPTIQKILQSILTIQRVYRGYRVRRQLNEDLSEICKKVREIKQKISNKKSKYWQQSEQKFKQYKRSSNSKNENKDSMSSNENERCVAQFGQEWSGRKTDRRVGNKRDNYSKNIGLNDYFNEQLFVSILSSQNSIQNANCSQSPPVPVEQNYLELRKKNQRQNSSRSNTNRKSPSSLIMQQQGQYQQEDESFFINYPNDHSQGINNTKNERSSILDEEQLRYLQQLVTRDYELSRKLLRQNEQLKEHIRSISSQHVRSTDIWRDEQIKNNQKQIEKNSKKNNNKQQQHQPQQQQADSIQNHQKKQQQLQKQSQSKKKKKKVGLLSIDLLNDNYRKEKQEDHIKENGSQANNNNVDAIFEPYSPKHYIISPKNHINALISGGNQHQNLIMSPRNKMNQIVSPTLSKLVSPISNSSSSMMLNHNQIPFSLQSPQHIMQGQRMMFFNNEELINKNHNNTNNYNRKQATNGVIANRQEKQQKNKQTKDIKQNEEDTIKEQQLKSETTINVQLLSQANRRKVQMLNKLFYEDKLLSPKTYENKINKIKVQNQQKAKTINNQEKTKILENASPKNNQLQNTIENKENYKETKNNQINIEQSPYHQTIEQSPYHELSQPEQQQSYQHRDDVSGSNKQKGDNNSKKKVKLTQLAGNFIDSNQQQQHQEMSKKPQNSNKNKMSVSKALFRIENGEVETDQRQDKQFHYQKIQLKQQQREEGIIQQNQQDYHDDKIDSLSHSQHQQPQIHQQQPPTRLGFPTQLLFIKNYIFQFFQFIKTHQYAQKILLNNLISLPFDNQHLLTCYRTQLREIDPHYESKVEGNFLSYPYWKNLIDYEPVVTTQIFQEFTQMIQSKREPNQNLLQRSARSGSNINEHQQQDTQSYDWMGLTAEQQIHYQNKYKQERLGLRDLQRIFLMMLMDAFNQAFQEQRCSYSSINLLRQQKGSMANYNLIRKTLTKIKLIEEIEKNTPAYYHLGSEVSANESQLESSNNHQFFTLHKLRRQKEEMVDVIFCSVLKRVLQNWGRQMCGLIIEPQQEDEMQITLQQIQAKNMERLCLALNKHVQEYEKEMMNMLREHQVSTKLIVTDKVLQTLLWQLARDVMKVQQIRDTLQ